MQANTWDGPGINIDLAQEIGRNGTCEQCMYGLQTWDTTGNMVPAKKPTRFMSNSLDMLGELSQQCNGKHRHQHLMSGRTAHAASCPLKLLKAILTGI